METIDSIDAEIAKLQARRAELVTNKRIAVRAQIAAASRKVPILNKTRNQRGMTYGGDATGMFAEFGQNDEGKKTIHLTGRYGNYEDVDRTFAEGDVCRYDSYNFDFCGTIERITDKTVRIKEDHGGRMHQLDLATFANKNYKFDLEKSNAERAAWHD